MNKYKINRGEIYMADLGEGKGSIQGGVRPVVIISNAPNNKYSPIVNVLPVTTKLKNNIPVHVNIGVESGLQRNSTILIEQILTVNKFQLTELVGKCTKNTMREIAKAIALQTSLQEDLVS